MKHPFSLIIGLLPVIKSSLKYWDFYPVYLVGFLAAHCGLSLCPLIAHMTYACCVISSMPLISPFHDSSISYNYAFTGPCK